MGKGRYAGKSSEGDMSRKDKRKQLRKQKKQRRIAFHTKKSDYKGQADVRSKKNNLMNANNKKKVTEKGKGEAVKTSIALNHANKPNKAIHAKLTNSSIQSRSPALKQQVTTNKKKTQQQLQNQAEILREEKQIEYYEKLLGVNKKKGKYQGIAKGLGYEDDLFDFLDNISKKVKSSREGYGVDGMEGDGEGMDEENEGMQEEEYDEDQNSEQLQVSSQQHLSDNFQPSNMSQIQEQQNEGDSQEPNSQDDDNLVDKQQQFQQQQYLLDDGDCDDEDQEMNDMWDILGGQAQQEENKFLSGKSERKKNGKGNNSEIVENNQSAQKKSNKKVQQQHNEQNAPLKAEQQQQEQHRPSLFGNMSQQQKQHLQIRKQMNAIFNKLSDGNLMISFRQFSQIFLSAPKSSTIPIFIDLFRRFNVQVQKPHLHILLSNIALASALHHLMGNRLMAPLTYQLIKCFTQLQNTDQDQVEIEQIGYSKIFQKKKNIILIFSYLYHFGSLTGEFIHSLVQHLSQYLNSHNVQFLYIIIQKIGWRIRQSDPGILKSIIDTLRQSIQKFRLTNQHHSQLSKINIIQTQLNQIKFNRKVELFSDQRMAFFTTFLSKNIPKQINTQKQVLLANFEQLKKASVVTTMWWENLQHEGNSHRNQQEDGLKNQEEMEIMMNEITSQRRKLLELAKSLGLVTQIRKNIFVEIMQAGDYLQAAQRVLALRIKNLQEIAVVLIQTCILQPTFNPYYPLVASKIANINPKFKSKIQFTLWDQIKLLQSYDTRKISNLSKFTARFIGNHLTDGSLSILKYFPDLINVHPSEAMFLIIFFTELLHVAKKQTLARMSEKLKQPSNITVKESILEYIKQVGARQKGFNNTDKMKFLRRMIILNQKQDQPHERY